MSLSKNQQFISGVDDEYAKYAHTDKYDLVEQMVKLARTQVTSTFFDISSPIDKLSVGEATTILNAKGRLAIPCNLDEDKETQASEATHRRYALVNPYNVKSTFQYGECPFEAPSFPISTDEGDVKVLEDAQSKVVVETTPRTKEGEYLTTVSYKNSYVFRDKVKNLKYNSALMYIWNYNDYKACEGRKCTFSDITVEAIVVTGGRQAGHSNLVGWVEKYMQGDKALKAGSPDHFMKIMRCPNGPEAQNLGGRNGGLVIPDGFFDLWSKESILSLVRADMTRLGVPAMRMWFDALYLVQKVTSCKILFVEVTDDDKEFEWGCGLLGDTLKKKIEEGTTFADLNERYGLSQLALVDKPVSEINWVFNEAKLREGSLDVVINKSGVSKHIIFNLFKQLRPMKEFPSSLFTWKSLYVVNGEEETDGDEEDESPRKRAKSDTDAESQSSVVETAPAVTSIESNSPTY